LLCSYTWSQDAQKIGSRIGEGGKGNSDELLDLCIKSLAQHHANIITKSELRDQLMEYYAYDSGADPNMSGGVAMFAPGQFQRTIQHLTRHRPNGHLNFVGEGKL